MKLHLGAHTRAEIYTGENPGEGKIIAFAFRLLDCEHVVRVVNAHDELVAICQDFVDKVERGEARSRRTYARMKAALALEV